MNPSYCLCTTTYKFSAVGWEFLAEGGATIVFRHSELCLVLKSQKQRLSPSLPFTNNINNSQDNCFVQFMIMLVYGSDITDVSSLNVLSDADHSLFHNLWISNRSLSRKQSSLDVVLTLSRSVCLVRYAYTFCGPLRSRSVGFEFKVKRGFPSRSPFIAEHSGYLKHNMGRFQLMQLYRQAKKHASGELLVNWGEFLSHSHYNPTDLCSQTSSLIGNAVSALFTNPQNNLQVFANGRLVYGSTQYDRLACISELTNLLLGESQSIEEADTMIQRILVEVIETSDIFMRLETLQYLDFIDSEGAAIIYQRLSELHTAISVEQIDDDLSKIILEYFEASVDKTDWFEFAASLRDQNRESVADHLSPGICALLSLLIYDHKIDIEEKKRRYKSVMCLVIQLTFDDCLFLMKAWMIGCVAADASIVVCIAPLSLSDMEEDRSFDPQTFAVQVPDNNGTCHKFLTRLTALDIGLKSFSKFERKAKSDAEICRVVNEYLNSTIKSES